MRRSPATPIGVVLTVALLAIACTGGGPEGGVERFTIYRNASQPASLPGSATTYTDTSALPGNKYSCEIEARAGETVADRVLVNAGTPLPPLRAARVAGNFDVNTAGSALRATASIRRPTSGGTFGRDARTGPAPPS